MFAGAIHWYYQRPVAVFAVVALAAIAIELIHRFWRRTFDAQESATSVVSGVSFLVVKNVVSKLVMLGLSMWVYDHLRLTTLDLGNSWVWLGVFLARDAIYYWVHRTEHRVRVLWASHLIHHSPDSIGFATAVRVPWMEAIYKPWLGLWVPLIGFHPAAFIALDVFAAIIGQLQHTTACKKRTVLDSVFVTPSAHRVHHASNREYIDKNFGAVLIIWDRMFGTYAPEVTPVIYGLTGGKTIDTPMEVLVGGYPELMKAARNHDSMADSLRYLIAPPA
jgi:sterol desaturase/sphingolipid hydroxylase (fatty acid hydroxylase superfamily)